MRGKPVRRHFDAAKNRIIPAHAGQTPPTASTSRPPPDHPRACGANQVKGAVDRFESGSSPRMRGKLVAVVTHQMTGRIIPAHAGQTTPPSRFPPTSTDHPRACGANRARVAHVRGIHGSSPRMRGKRQHRQVQADHGRIIPAHAGQTPPFDALSWFHPDHPRACGANKRRVRLSSGIHGSSPRMRGKQSDFMRKLLSAGPSIIGFAQWLQSSYYCSCLQSSAKTPISRGTTPTSLFLGFQNSITLLLLT